eukprot:jgi/Undpi1/2518/HiC_scaffold_13.g05897.m1
MRSWWPVKNAFGRSSMQMRTFASGPTGYVQRPLAFDSVTQQQQQEQRQHQVGRGGVRAGNTSAEWHLSGAFTRFDRRFEIFEVSKAGDLRRTSVTLANVLRDFGVHARDVLSLGLQDERYHPPPAVLPREGVVVIALGPFKALIHTEACLLFEAGSMNVSHIVPVLAELMQANAEVPPSEDVGDGSDKGVSAGGIDEGRAGGGANTAQSTGPMPPDNNPPASTNRDARELRQEETVSSSPPRLPVDPASIPSSASTTADGGARDPPSANTADGGSRVETPQKKLGGDVRRRGEGVVGGGGATGGGGDREEFSGMASRFGAYVEALGFGGGQEGHGGDVDGEEEEKDVQEHQMKVMFREQRPMPFELAMLEAMLQEVCTSYHRRAHVVRRLMEHGLRAKESTSPFTPNRVEHYRVVPLKLALKQLELKLSQTRDCLEELMHSDEDMLGLLLTEKKELEEGEILDPHRHSVVELLLENYHRQLVLVGHDVAALKQEMESMQELAAISLDVSRNSMIAVDIRLAMLNLGVASSACVFGAMGMNVVNGMESSHLAFYGLLGGSAAASAAALGGVVRHLRSVARAGDSQQGRLMALSTICDHVDDIESVLRTELDSGRGGSNSKSSPDAKKDCRGVIDRKSMARKLSRARGREISEEELDLIFAVFDTTGDGSIDKNEYGKLVTDPAGFLGNHVGTSPKRARQERGGGVDTR